MREDFPILKNNDVVYFDNGATTLKPNCVVQKMVDYYTKYTSNIHRGEYSFAIKTNKEYDGVRDIVKDFIGAKDSREVVFTSGSTESLNMIVFGFFAKTLTKDDEIILNKGEHASLILPFLVLQKTIGFTIKYAKLNDEYEVSVDSIKSLITDKTKVVALSQISNVVGDIRDTESIGKLCRDNNIYFVVDASQAVGHISVDVVRDNISFLAFSAHKMLGPTGVGVMWGKYELIDEMDPIIYGGGMNQSFDADGIFEIKSPPNKFEAGTPPIAEVIGMGEAIKYIKSVGVENIHEHEKKLKKYLIQELEKIDNVILYNKTSGSGIVTFNLDKVFSQDTAVYLNHYNIFVRAGNHCTKMLKDEMNIKNTCRVSMHIYNNKDDVDKLINALKDSRDIFKVVI